LVNRRLNKKEIEEDKKRKEKSLEELSIWLNIKN
jgi:hypothetical protein